MITGEMVRFNIDGEHQSFPADPVDPAKLVVSVDSINPVATSHDLSNVFSNRLAGD